MTRMARWRKELREPLPEPQVPDPRSLSGLHDAVIRETIDKAGPTTFLWHLAEIVARHLETRDRAIVKAAVNQLRASGLVRPFDPDTVWERSSMWEVLPF